MGPAPPLADGLWQALVTDDEIRNTIAGGRPGTLMPAFARRSGGMLADDDLAALVAEVRALAAPRDPLPDGVPRLAGSDSPGDPRRGTQQFARACAACHGADGRGSERAGAIHDAALLALVSDRLLRRVIVAGREDLGMPDYAQSTGRGEEFTPLTNQDVADLVALLGQWRSEGSRLRPNVSASAAQAE